MGAAALNLPCLARTISDQHAKPVETNDAEGKESTLRFQILLLRRHRRLPQMVIIPHPHRAHVMILLRTRLVARVTAGRVPVAGDCCSQGDEG